MKKSITKICFILVLVSAFCFFPKTFAQSTTTDEATSSATTTPALTQEQVQQELEKYKEDQLYQAQEASQNFEVNFSPANPGANAQVSAQLISYTFDVDRADIAWLLNGKKAGSGKTFSFTVGDIGSRTHIDVLVITADGFTVSKSFDLRIAEVDLLWEAQTFTPPQYRGKALVSSQSPFKITAMPQGFGVSDSKLVYEWTHNGKNLPLISGQGKKTFTFLADDTGPETIGIKVSTLNKSTVAENQVAINIDSPKILFYEDRPLEGPQFQNELGSNFTLSKQELILLTEPFFFSIKDLPGLSYEWRINDKKIDTPQKPNLLNLAVSSGTKGTSIVNLSITNPNNILEAVNKSLQVNFNF